MAIGNFNSAGGAQIPPVGFVWLSVENTSPEIYFENTTWELISQNRVLMGAGDGHNGGDTVEAGLPNITGKATFINSDGIDNNKYPDLGAFYFGANSYPCITTITSGTGKRDLQFDASRSSAIYGKSATVQPPAYYVYMWRRTS